MFTDPIRVNPYNRCHPRSSLRARDPVGSLLAMRRVVEVSLPGGATLTLGPRTIVVGILNVTPDSFSDGGRHFEKGAAIAQALRMEEDGADIVEIGGESTRPGAARLSAAEELSRIAPVLEALAGRLRVPISVDTYKAEVAEAAIVAGASIINDVSALRFDAELANVVARHSAALVLMHMRGEPATMQKGEFSDDIFAEIDQDFTTAIRKAESRGVERQSLILDPGIGFGKSLRQNLELINHLDRFEHFGLPLMIGASRKSFIGRVTGRPESDRLFGTASSVAISILRGAHIVRVHDVKEMVEVARVADALASV
jgi:dihydropteroate synthase